MLLISEIKKTSRRDTFNASDTTINLAILHCNLVKYPPSQTKFSRVFSFWDRDKK